MEVDAVCFVLFVFPPPPSFENNSLRGIDTFSGLQHIPKTKKAIAAMQQLGTPLGSVLLTGLR